MAVMTMSFKKGETTHEGKIKKCKKSLEKCRPITATLEHPLILDIKLLQRLDMTTFTKKGLIALSNFSGVSLITKKGSDKINKYLKSIKDYNNKKENDNTNRNDSIILQRKKCTQSKISRFKQKNNYKIITTESSSQDEEDEDSADVVCKKHHEKGNKFFKKKLNVGKEGKLSNGKNLTMDENIQNGQELTSGREIVPEPCKSCSRLKQPERLHSHPKLNSKTMENKKKGGAEKKILEEKINFNLKNSKISNEKGKSKKIETKEKNSSAKVFESPKEFLSLSSSEDNSNNSNSNIPSKLRSNFSYSPKINKIQMNDEEKKNICDLKTNKESSSPGKSGSESLKYVTGCYVCGSQVPPNLRIKHEKECIQEWRNQNSFLSPKDRKPEPVRPDFRFTESGDLDCEGTFESIWANHQDSLVPCKKCGRTFFPDRIEKHENCCNNLPLRVKNKN